jgi:hypothetical protein
MENSQSFQAINEWQRHRPIVRRGRDARLMDGSHEADSGRPLATGRVREPVDIFTELELDDDHDHGAEISAAPSKQAKG